jgi:hypothetical protein
VETNLFLAPGEGGTDEPSNGDKSTSQRADAALPEAIRLIRGGTS